ncbi:MAG: phenylacetic acid degradation operon negative regulatory protein PaaX, partial [Chloroflexota bacterium]|nr:phenylacetic acid degradation operon negative regulatory protein PaaX [Chloroflexota bacterium]
HYGGKISAGGVIRTGREFELSEAAMRSALSRMCKAGWLVSERDGGRAYYASTAKTDSLLQEGVSRIFTRRDETWNGEWTVLCYVLADTPREVRDKFRQRLTWLGFGSLMPGTWVAARNLTNELEVLIDDLHLSASIEYFCGQHLGVADDHELVHRCWNLQDINHRYRRFVGTYEPAYERDCRLFEAGTPPPDNECFVHRFLLIHDYRYFFRIDPELPPHLLPADWSGRKAASLFSSYHRMLTAPAVRFYLAANA